MTLDIFYVKQRRTCRGLSCPSGPRTCMLTGRCRQRPKWRGGGRPALCLKQRKTTAYVTCIPAKFISSLQKAQTHL